MLRYSALSIITLLKQKASREKEITNVDAPFHVLILPTLSRTINVVPFYVYACPCSLARVYPSIPKAKRAKAVATLSLQYVRLA